MSYPHPYPRKIEGSCYDCGSTIKGHHTLTCELTSKDDIRDLPAIPGTQWWIKCTTDGTLKGEYVPVEQRQKAVF